MIKPLNNYILIEVIESDLARENKNQIPTGIVIAICENINDIKVDDRVIFSRNSGEFINYQSRVYLMVSYKDIMAVLS